MHEVIGAKNLRRKAKPLERGGSKASRLVALMSTAADAIRSVQGRIQKCF
jgi:hypothetical protein